MQLWAVLFINNCKNSDLEFDAFSAAAHEGNEGSI